MKHFYLTTLFFLLLSGCQGTNGTSPASSDSGSNGSTQGKAGSMARFGITGNALYVLSDDKVKTFNISQSATPVLSSTVLLGSGIETIFPYSGKLFFGTTTGMLIYNNEDPFAIKYISRYEHITSCDPVVVSGKYAYVTLRTGTRCWNGWNRLDIIDLSDIANPKLANSYSMTNPKGLGIDEHTLFLCDGDAGLKVYDISDPLTLVVKAEYKGINAYDVIPTSTNSILSGNKTLVMTGDSGIYQYDYTDLNNIKQLSQIKVQ
jgi:hypothetical protein